MKKKNFFCTTIAYNKRQPLFSSASNLSLFNSLTYSLFLIFHKINYEIPLQKNVDINSLLRNKSVDQILLISSQTI